MPIVRPVYPNELYHYGVKGMHWGIRRYQPYPKGYSGSGKYLGKRSRIGLTISSKTKRPKISPEQREWLINRGSAKQIMEYGDQLTTEEKQKAIARMRADNDLMRMTYQRGLTTYNDFSSAVSNTTKIMKNLTDMPKTFGARSGSGKSAYSGSGGTGPINVSFTPTNDNYNGTPAGDWYGIHGGRKVDKLTNKERDERREKLRKRRRNLAIGLGVGGAAALGAGLYLNKKYKNKARLLNASAKISSDQADKLFNNAKNYSKQAQMVSDSADELIKRGKATGNRAMLNTAKAQLLGNANLLRQGKANAVQSANLTNRATRERLEALNYDTRRTYAKILAGAGGTALADAALYGFSARRRKLRKKSKRRR